MLESELGTGEELKSVLKPSHIVWNPSHSLLEVVGKLRTTFHTRIQNFFSKSSPPKKIFFAKVERLPEIARVFLDEPTCPELPNQTQKPLGEPFCFLILYHRDYCYLCTLKSLQQRHSPESARISAEAFLLGTLVKVALHCIALHWPLAQGSCLLLFSSVKFPRSLPLKPEESPKRGQRM